MKKQLHPGSRWLFRLRGYSVAIILIWILVWLSFSVSSFFISNQVTTLLISLIFGILIIIILAEIYARMAYNRWFYEFTDSQLRIERGIIWKKYSNIPYERIQNVDITRGIIARICGFSTVNIQTAGFSYTPNKTAHSEGYIPGVPMDEAEDIREFLMKKISKRSRRQGL